MTVATVTPDRERAVLAAVPSRLFIAGTWRDASGGATFDVLDPATGATLAAVADATAEDARAALDGCVAAQAGWAATPPRARGELLGRAYEAMTARSEELALLMTLEMGKSLAESRGEVAYAAEFLRWYAEEAVRIDGRFALAPDGNSRLLTMKQPVGPCYAITPWNFPLALVTRKLGPALAAGCTMVVKPAQQTPLCALALAALLGECGLPPGVVAVLPTTAAADVSAPLIADPRLRKLTFTGSTAIGRLLQQQAAPGLLRSSMELGGNAPFLVFADADLDAAVEGAIVAKMRNIGEACTAANRFHVERSVTEEFTARLAARMSALQVGRGTEAEVGPLIDAAQRGKVAELVDDAVARGARAVLGGAVPDGPGCFYPPTVLADVPPDARLLREELFGPVAPVIPFDDEDAAVAAANDTEYGLAAYLYTRDLARALRVGERLETGMVGLNQGLVSNPAAPFGGIKASGFGREGGREGIEEYLATKYLAIAR